MAKTKTHLRENHSVDDVDDPIRGLDIRIRNERHIGHRVATPHLIGGRALTHRRRIGTACHRNTRSTDQLVTGNDRVGDRMEEDNGRQERVVIRRARRSEGGQDDSVECLIGGSKDGPCSTT